MAGPLLACDAPSLLFRAFHALPSSIRGSGGRPVGALLGSVNMVLLEIERHAPRAVVMCFGAEAAAYRLEALPGEYHADREEELPAELDWQWQRAPGLYRELGWAVDSHEELEADDLLGAYAAAEKRAGGTALVLTGDRDLFQCVGERIRILYLSSGPTRGGQVVDAQEVERRYGIAPELVPDFIALRGDPSDGIPGAPGIGEKTAADLLRRHGSLTAAIDAAEGERPAVASALREHARQLATYREVATLQPVDVELPPDGALDARAGAEAARALGMDRLADRLLD